jgi:precorrin-2 dehydrogenase / sirohydrochlorin ferrochelatase
VSSNHLTSGTDTGFYPVFMDISGKTCLVVGGGGVAERKVRMLLKFNAVVRLVSPRVTKGLLRMEAAGRLAVARREYQASDLEGATIVFAATNIDSVNARVKADAETRNILVNVVDNPRLCDFIVPSIVKKGPIVIAISTSGTLPSLSRKLRMLIAEQIGDDYVRYVDIVGRVRKLLLETERDSEKRKKILGELREMDIKEVNRMGFRRIKNRFLTSGK